MDLLAKRYEDQPVAVNIIHSFPNSETVPDVLNDPVFSNCYINRTATTLCTASCIVDFGDVSTNQFHKASVCMAPTLLIPTCYATSDLDPLSIVL